MTKLSWDDISDYVELIYSDIDNYKIGTIVGISRGGMIPAVMMSHKLEVKNICMVIADSYDKNNSKSDDTKISNIYGELKGDLLVIDDVNDTGDTLSKILNKLDHYSHDIKTAVLVNKIDSSFCPNFYGVICNDWVQFPWEVS